MKFSRLNREDVDTCHPLLVCLGCEEVFLLVAGKQNKTFSEPSAEGLQDKQDIHPALPLLLTAKIPLRFC